MSQWEDSSAQEMSHVWVTDCDSLYEHLVAEKANHVDNKRLAIDLLAMRQLIWERGGERTEIVDSSCGDYPRWIDTSTMIADPLTKAMSCDRTVATSETGVFDMRPTEESLAIKAKNRDLRKKVKNQQKAVKDMSLDIQNEIQDAGDCFYSCESGVSCSTDTGSRGLHADHTGSQCADFPACSCTSSSEPMAAPRDSTPRITGVSMCSADVRSADVYSSPRLFWHEGP